MWKHVGCLMILATLTLVESDVDIQCTSNLTPEEAARMTERLVGDCRQLDTSLRAEGVSLGDPVPKGLSRQVVRSVFQAMDQNDDKVLTGRELDDFAKKIENYKTCISGELPQQGK
nr:EF-hand and SPARC domain-containing protein [Crepidula fornicata]